MQDCAGMAFAKCVAPVWKEAAIGGSERRCFRGFKQRGPLSIRTQPRPACSPMANNVASAFIVAGPSGVSNMRLPSAFRAFSRCRVRISTFWTASLPNHARSSGEAFMAFGKMRPELPTKQGCPRSSAHLRRAVGGKALRAGASHSCAVP